jgi:hypothetical protein
MKQRYITPGIKVVQLMTDENIAQFVVSSHSVGESEGLAKPGFFEEEDEEEIVSSGEKSWGDVSY